MFGSFHITRTVEGQIVACLQALSFFKSEPPVLLFGFDSEEAAQALVDAVVEAQQHQLRRMVHKPESRLSLGLEEIHGNA